MEWKMFGKKRLSKLRASKMLRLMRGSGKEDANISSHTVITGTPYDPAKPFGMHTNLDAELKKAQALMYYHLVFDRPR